MEILFVKLKTFAPGLLLIAAAALVGACHVIDGMKSEQLAAAEPSFNVPMLLISSSADGVYQSINGKILVESNTGAELEFQINGFGEYLQIPDTGADEYLFSFYAEDIPEARQYVLSAAQLREYTESDGANVWTVDFAQDVAL